RKKADIAHRVFKEVKGIIALRPEGAFYMSVVFEDGVLNKKQSLHIVNQDAKEYVERVIPAVSPDKQFAYYLMAGAGICVVPLSGFNSDLYGFRITLLEANAEVFEENLHIIAQKIKEYLKS
ncbi:MAG: aminotransferase, partial [Candidatus Yonathbacteria bacterium]|nr:aminotransferase [Candidatus Yonathbacteria bacterium]